MLPGDIKRLLFRWKRDFRPRGINRRSFILLILFVVVILLLNFLLLFPFLLILRVVLLPIRDH
jgi:hypothetical protein